MSRKPGNQRLSLVALRNAIFAAITRTSSLFVGILLTPIVLAGLGRELYGVAQVVGSFYEYISLIRGGISTALRELTPLLKGISVTKEATRVTGL